jgi:molybdopterin synthase sulfur carrier subunit
MAKVVIPAGLSKQYTGGKAEFKIDASTVRAVIRKLDAEYPGIGRAIEIDMAVAVDNEIYQDPLLEPVKPESEVYFLPRIGGG